MRISREGGASGVVIVQWRSFPVHSSYGSDDIAPLNSNITFLSNEREKVLVIDVEPDATPEINEVRFVKFFLLVVFISFLFVFIYFCRGGLIDGINRWQLYSLFQS